MPHIRGDVFDEDLVREVDEARAAFEAEFRRNSKGNLTRQWRWKTLTIFAREGETVK